MENNFNKVLNACIKQARKGGSRVGVFDLMYETSLAYPELKDILDKLVLKNELEVIDIKTYKFIGDINRKFDEPETHQPVFQNVENSPGKDAALAARRAYMEERRKELIARMQAEEENGDDKTDTYTKALKKCIEDGKAAVNVRDNLNDIDEDELRYKALKLCIEINQVSVSMIQRSFPIGYIKSCNLVDWMEDMGYISSSENSEPRKVLITLDEFNKIFNESDCEEESLFDDDDEDEEDVRLDEKFAEYERYLQTQFFGPDNCDDADSEDGQMEELIDYLKELFQLASAVSPQEEIPVHPSWEDENKFMQFCGECLSEIVNSNKKMGRRGALKIAKELLEEAKKSRNKKMIEIYGYIVFELKNMSNYYYIKIREGLL